MFAVDYSDIIENFQPLRDSAEQCGGGCLSVDRDLFVKFTDWLDNLPTTYKHVSEPPLDKTTLDVVN